MKQKGRMNEEQGLGTDRYAVFFPRRASGIPREPEPPTIQAPLVRGRPKTATPMARAAPLSPEPYSPTTLLT